MDVVPAVSISLFPFAVKVVSALPAATNIPLTAPLPCHLSLSAANTGTVFLLFLRN